MKGSTKGSGECRERYIHIYLYIGSGKSSGKFMEHQMEIGFHGGVYLAYWEGQGDLVSTLVTCKPSQAV